jgi:hypothetical protein
MDNQDAPLSPAAASPATRSTDRVNSSLGRIIVSAIALIAATYFALFGYFLFRTAITSPISDMFAYIDDYLHFRAGQVSLLEYLWHAHGEHHLVWIRLLTWADVEMFHVRGIPFMVAATAAIVGTAILIWRQLWRAEPMLGGATSLGLLAPMLVLSAANVTDCSVPINTTYPLTVFFVVLALILFTGAEPPNTEAHLRRIAAMLAAVGASFGTAAGLLAWPILLWIAWRERLDRGWLIALAAAAIGYIIFYMQGINFLGLASGADSGIAAFVSVPHLHKLMNYFLAFLGLPFSRQPAFGATGRVIGAALFLAGLAAVLMATFSGRLSGRLDRVAIGMILLAFGSACLAAVGRGDIIDEVKVPVRYTMFTTTLQAGLLCIILPRVVRHREIASVRILQCSAGLFLALVLLILQVIIGHSAVQIAGPISRNADCFAQGAQAGPVSPVVIRWPEEGQRVLTALREQGLLAPKSVDCGTGSQK